MSDKFIFRFVTVISVVVFALVIVLNRKLIPVTMETPSFVYLLPGLNAVINGTCSILLMASFYFIRKKNIPVHRSLNLTAFVLSAVFLISYVVFHYFALETKFGGVGSIRLVYYFILITHIILAAVVLPLILLSFHRGLQMNVEKHRKIVRWSFPIWLYVTVSGVVVYLMISPYYAF